MTGRQVTAGSISSKRLLGLTRRLIEVYSPFGKEEGAVDLLQAFLEKAGLKVREQRVSKRRRNLVVLPRTAEPELVLLGHIDTVTAHDMEQIVPRQEGDILYGLGSADMKAGLAAMVEAFCVARQDRGENLPVALAVVVGEEDEGDGAEAFIREYSIPWALIGEPTDLRVCPANCGYIEVHLCARGQRLHASLADLRHSPVSAILDYLQSLMRFVEREHSDWIVNIRDLISAKAGFAVPDQCEARIDIHVPPATALEPLIFDIEGLAAGIQNQAELQVRFATIIHGYALPADTPFIERLRSIYAAGGRVWDPQPFRSHSDANILWAGGTKTVLLGPGALESAHTPDEHVSSREILEAAGIYLEILRRI